MGRIHWISSDPEKAILIEESNTPPTYERMQDYVEGSIELVTVLFNGQQNQMIVNEEGIIKNLPKNSRATEIYWAMAKSQGYDLEKKEDRQHLQDEWKKEWESRFSGLGTVAHINIDPRAPDEPPVVQGNAIILEGM